MGSYRKSFMGVDLNHPGKRTVSGRRIFDRTYIPLKVF